MKTPLMCTALIALALPVAAQAGDAALGEKAFGPCSACHTVDPKGEDMTGPNLAGVFGSTAATRRTGYPYSDALKASKLVWTAENLDAWIKEPAALVPGTHMDFIGVARKPTRENIIAYLQTLAK